MLNILVLYPVIGLVIAVVMVISALLLMFIAFKVNTNGAGAVVVFKLFPWLLAHLLMLGAGVLLDDYVRVQNQTLQAASATLGG